MAASRAPVSTYGADARPPATETTNSARARSAAPPLAWWWPSAAFVVAALALVLAVLVPGQGPGPLDDPNPSYQRDGRLDEGPVLPAQFAGVVFGGRVVVVLFERRAPAGPEFGRWQARLTRAGAEVVVAVAGSDRTAGLAQAVQMRTPNDEGTPVGYAIVDPARRVRYTTLDPAYLINAFEVDLLVAAVSGPTS